MSELKSVSLSFQSEGNPAPVRWVIRNEVHILQQARTVTRFENGSPTNSYIEWYDVPVVNEHD